MRFADATTPLWTCPHCGHRFVTSNSWHSCSKHKLEDHFKDKPARVRKLFDAWSDFVLQFGEVTVIPQKTRISFQVRVRFAGAVIRKNWVECAFWLKRQVKDERFHRVEKITARDYIYYFRLTDESQLDKTMKEYLREAYQVGCQVKRV
ncbi:MAG: hypothetical protein HZB19_22155 [Chloroflexi bacterium]|nr:hypothetical protein [Chloroflexota bacterium]